MEYGRAVTFPLQDPSWMGKVALGALIGLVPIANMAQAGYGLEVTRRVADGHPEELPRWDRFGQYLSKGFGVAVASLLWSLPVMLLGLLALFWGLRGTQLSTASSGDGLAVLTPAPGAGLILVAFLALLVGAVLWAAFPVAMLRYAVTEQWVSMFDFGWILRYLGKNLGAYLLMLLVVSVVGAVGGVAVLLLQMVPFLGILVLLPAGFWMVLVLGHLLGQLGRQGQTV